MSYVLGKIDKNKCYFVGNLKTAVRLNELIEQSDELRNICYSENFPKSREGKVMLDYMNKELNKINLHILSFDYMWDAGTYENGYNGFKETNYKYNAKDKKLAIELMKKIIVEKPQNVSYGWDGNSLFFSENEDDFIYTIIDKKDINNYVQEGDFAPITVRIYESLCHFHEWSKGKAYEHPELLKLARYIVIQRMSKDAGENDVLIKENGEYKIVDKSTVDKFLINTNSLNYCAGAWQDLDRQYVFLESCKRLIPNF